METTPYNGVFFKSGSPKPSQTVGAKGLGSLERRFAGTSDTFSSSQAWYFWQVAKTLAFVGRNERLFRRPFFVAGAVIGELGRRCQRVESLVLSLFDLGHDDFTWQVLMFHGRRGRWSTPSETSFFRFSMLIFPGAHSALGEFLRCDRAALSSLCLCLAVVRRKFLILLAQPSRHFARARWLSLWRSAHFGYFSKILAKRNPH